MGRTRTRKKGSMNVAGTKKWDGTKWVPVNVARDGQRATRNGKPVVRKGGKWVPVKTSTRTTTRRRSSGNNSTPTKTAPKPTLKDIPASKRPADMQAGRVYGDAGQPPAPKLPPKPSPPKPTSTKPTPTKPTPTKPTYSKPSTTKGPTKSGNYIASKGSSTKGGPTADGKTYKSQIKSKRLRDALSSLKVRDYKKKK